MTDTYSIQTLFFGQFLYAVATFIRFVRLHASMGKARPAAVVELAAAHCLGVSLGYYFGVFWYELTILLFFAFFKRNTLVSAAVALVLIRGLDAAFLLIVSLYISSYENMRLVLLFLTVLLSAISFLFISVNTVIRRIEKKILEFPYYTAYIIPILKSINTIRSQITLLHWKKQGSFSILIILTIGGWIMEWLAFFCLLPTAEQATASMIGRVMRSMFFMARNDTHDLIGILQYGVYGLLAFMLLVNLLVISIARRAKK